jgi:hypothetical protein
VDKQAGFKMLYAALDSMEAGQQAMPFFATFEEKKDPSASTSSVNPSHCPS